MLEAQGSERTLTLSIPVAQIDLTFALFIDTALHVKAANSLGGKNWPRKLNKNLASYMYRYIWCNMSANVS